MFKLKLIKPYFRVNIHCTPDNTNKYDTSTLVIFFH